jgi:hypothetical protein
MRWKKINKKVMELLKEENKKSNFWFNNLLLICLFNGKILSFFEGKKTRSLGL